ncbi:hypothetical protein AVEN_32181-1 [Araneus ventricosus]|uniref:Uncharacterized protein n=1 Tax=Araneus ventricosus TaxID=182803 RepID=A0A4Y2S1J2_ARAVE|nr:hypothetical protein AVEN_32181-1 [Araneus ventricosus]
MLVWDRPRNFEPRSDDEDNTRTVTPSPNIRSTPEGRRLATTYDLACNRPPYTVDPQWNRVPKPRPYHCGRRFFRALFHQFLGYLKPSNKRLLDLKECNHFNDLCTSNQLIF